MSSSDTQSRGLEWIEGTFGLEAGWTLEPDETTIKDIAQTRANLNAVVVSFLGQGGFNKLYTIESTKEPLVMRVSLPVDPRHKTLIEVATLRWMRDNTSVPIPEVIDFEASSDNRLGFEWILMTRMPGKPLRNSWTKLSLDSKVKIVKQIAEHQSRMFHQRLRCIGNIYPDQLVNSPPLKAGRIVSMHFFWGKRIQEEVPRGPFQTSYDWITSRLLLVERESNETISRNLDEGDVEDATRTLEIIDKLKGLIKDMFSPTVGQEQESTILFHDDPNSQNILVDDEGGLTGIVDWESVPALPIWKACDIPSFLDGRPRDEMPDETKFSRDADGQLNELYWIRLKEYELTLLRRIFLDEIGKLEPQWLQTYKSSQRQRDFDQAVTLCDSELSAKSITQWLEDAAKGVFETSLESLMYD